MQDGSLIRKYVIGGIALVAVIIVIGVFGVYRNSSKYDSKSGGESAEVVEHEQASTSKDVGVASLLQYSDAVASVNGQIVAGNSEEAASFVQKLQGDGIVGDAVIYKVIFLDENSTEVSESGELQVALKLPEEIITSAGDTLTAYYATADGYQVLSSYIMDGSICVVLPGGGNVAVVKSTNNIFQNIDVATATMYTNDTATVRSGPDTTYDSMEVLETGTEVQIVGKVRDSQWYMVKTESGYGYIREDLLSDTPVSKPATTTTTNTNTQRNTNTTTTRTQQPTETVTEEQKRAQFELEQAQHAAEEAAAGNTETPNEGSSEPTSEPTVDPTPAE